MGLGVVLLLSVGFFMSLSRVQCGEQWRLVRLRYGAMNKLSTEDAAPLGARVEEDEGALLKTLPAESVG